VAGQDGDGDGDGVAAAARVIPGDRLADGDPEDAEWAGSAEPPPPHPAASPTASAPTATALIRRRDSRRANMRWAGIGIENPSPAVVWLTPG
jgi:hypothetical protein